MKPYIGIFDRFFVKRVTMKLSGPGGSRTVNVAEKFLRKLQESGTIAPADGQFATAHIIDPGGAARASLGLGGSDQSYPTESWQIGVDIDLDDYSRFKHGPTGDIFVVVVYEEGQPHESLAAHELWIDLKSKLDSM